MATRRSLISPPWGGIDDSNPSVILPPNSFRSFQNFITDRGKLLTFPKLNNFTIPPNVKTILGARTFQDAANYLHTVFLTQGEGYYWSAGAYHSFGTWNSLGPNPYSYDVFNNRLYFTNGMDLRYVDGDGSSYSAGNANGGSLFVGKLSGHFLMLNCFENQLNFKNRIRYSAQNDADQWDGTVDPTAGEFDVEGIEDALTGWAVVRNVGFAVHSFGLTSLTPTGVANSPFFVENYSQGPQGSGCYFPGGLAQYGEIFCFPAIDDVYTFSAGGMQSISGKAQSAIYADLNKASSQVCSQMFGTLNQGRNYLSYWLGIPILSDSATSLWIYHFSENTWQNIQLTGALRTISSVLFN